MASKIAYIAKKVIPGLISIIVMVVLIGKLNLNSLPQIFENANVSLLLLSLFVPLIYHFVISVKKYKHLLNFFNVHVSEEEARLIRVGNMPLKAVVPYKAGEFLRAVYLKKNHDVSYQKGIYLIIWGYVTRFLVLLSIALVGVLLLYSSIKAYLILLVCSVLFASVFFLNKRYKHLVFYSILCELFLVATYVIIFRAFGINIPSGEILLYVPLVLILTGLPVSIMGIGVREAVIASFFIAKADFNTLLFSALSVSFVESVLPLLLSMVFLKKFISSMSVSNKETESFDAETDFERRIKKVIDSMSKYFRKKDMNLRGVEVAKKAG